MSLETNGSRSLRELELEVETEGGEWMRRRLEEKRQTEVNRHGGVFPPERTQGVASVPADDAAAHRLRRGGRWACGADKIRQTSAGAVRCGSAGG
jgi:hypothetical protein